MIPIAWQTVLGVSSEPLTMLMLTLWDVLLLGELKAKVFSS